MQIKNVTYGMTYKGYKNYRECLKMIEILRRFEKSEVVQQRLNIIEFYKRYGEKATKEAFGADSKVISRWRKRIKEGNIKGLIPINTRPNRLRKSKIDETRTFSQIKEKFIKIKTIKILQ